MQRAQAAAPGPVKGMPRISSSSCTVPSSPPTPCIATKATSGRSATRRLTRSAPTSIGSTSWPSRSSASSTRAPERSETPRSSERPPLRTATFIKPSPALRKGTTFGAGSSVASGSRCSPVSAP